MSSISFNLGYRYLRSKKGGIFSFTTILAILGLSIGVASLIIVTSVMNGFQKELENRILGVIPHAIVYNDDYVENYEELIEKINANNDVYKSSPYIEIQALISSSSDNKPVSLIGIEPDKEKELSILPQYMIIGDFENLNNKTKRLRLVEVVFLLKEITNLEMDLRFEAAAANEYAENTKNDAGFKVPEIYWNFTSENVMTLDWIDGISIREAEELKKRNLDTNKIAEDIIQHFLRHAVRDGFFHADMHQGNIFVDNSGQIVPIDFGIMGRLDKLSKRFLAEILFGFIQRDYRKVAEVHLVAGLVPKEVPIDDLAQALRSIGEPIFGQEVKDISGGKLLKQLFDVTEKFNMQTQPQLLMLQKTMVVVEGVARKLNPNTNIWTTSKPVLENWLKETKDPINNLNETLKNTSEVIKRLPEFPEIMDKANQALTFLASGQIPQNSNSYTALNDKKSEMIAFRNQSIIGLLLLVIFGLIVF